MVKFYIGTDNWRRKEWTGLLYPQNLNENDFLDYYTGHFNFIELNSTYYDFYPAVIKTWLSKIKHTSFRFCPWLPQKLFFTSRKPEQTVAGIKDFTATWNGMTEMLGPFTFPIIKQNAIGFAQRDRLLEVISKLPPENTYVLNIQETGEETPVLKEVIAFAAAHSIGIKLGRVSTSSYPTSIAYYKTDIENLPDIKQVIGQLPDHVREVYWCLSGNDKSKLLMSMKELTPLQTVFETDKQS